MRPVGPKPTISPSICLALAKGDAIGAKAHLPLFTNVLCLFICFSISGARYFGTV